MNYFLLNSNKLQLFDVEEVVEELNISRDSVVIIVRKTNGFRSKISIKKIDDVRQFYNWNKVRLIPSSGKVKTISNYSRFLGYILDQKYFSKQVDLAILQYGKPDKIFIGNYKNEGMRDVLNNYPEAEQYCLDEGNTTIGYINLRNQYFQSGKPTSISLVDKIKVLLFRLKNHHPSNQINFFTVYGGENSKKSNIIDNSYRNNKLKLLKSKNYSNKTIFIGSILVEFGLIYRDDYLSILKRIKDQYGLNSYYAHPKENDEDLDIYKSQLGIDIVRLDEPIELHFISKNSVEQNILTIQSSAIINLSKIFGSNLHYKVIKISDSIIQKKEFTYELSSIYQNFGSYAHIDVEKLK